VINSNVMCAKFADADYLAAAQAIVVEHGPAAATVASISERLRAPTGSFYHRVASRDVLLGKLWLKSIGRALAAVHEPGVGPVLKIFAVQRLRQLLVVHLPRVPRW
jgi:AcrR family transcriptional regulator